MIKYARRDTHYLLYIYDCLRLDLIQFEKSQNSESQEGEILRKVFEESQKVALNTYKLPEKYNKQYYTLMGSQRFVWDDLRMELFTGLWEWRTELAKAEDENEIYIIKNHILMQIVTKLPESQEQYLAINKSLAGSRSAAYCDQIVSRVKKLKNKYRSKQQQQKPREQSEMDMENMGSGGQEVNTKMDEEDLFFKDKNFLNKWKKSPHNNDEIDNEISDFKSWNITEKEVKIRIEESKLFDEIQKFSLNSPDDNDQMVEDSTEKNLPIFGGKSSLIGYLLHLYPEGKESLDNFVKCVDEVVNEEQEVLQKEEVATAEFMEFQSNNKKKDKKLTDDLVKNAASKSLSNSELLGKLDKMNYPLSLKEKFGTALSKMKREQPTKLDNDNKDDNSDEEEEVDNPDRYRKKIRTNDDENKIIEEKEKKIQRNKILAESNKFALLMDKPLKPQKKGGKDLDVYEGHGGGNNSESGDEDQSDDGTTGNTRDNFQNKRGNAGVNSNSKNIKKGNKFKKGDNNGMTSVDKVDSLFKMNKDGQNADGANEGNISFWEKCKLVQDKLHQAKEKGEITKTNRNNKKELLNNPFSSLKSTDPKDDKKNKHQYKKTKFGKYHVNNKVHM